jgi:cytochrome P450
LPATNRSESGIDAALDSSPLSGPRGLPLLGVALPIHRDAIGFFKETQRQHGNIASFKVLGSRILLVSNPSYAETVLVDDAASYGRSSETRNLRPIFGDGLLISEGEKWRSQRRRIQPSFSSHKLASYTTIMLSSMHERVQWTPGQTLEIHSEMMGFTRDVVCRSLFGYQPTSRFDRIADAISTVFGDLRAEVLYLPIWQHLPTPRSIRWRRALKFFDQTIAEIISERSRAGPMQQLDQQDMLGSLLAAQGEDGTTMSDILIRDEP